MELHVHEFQVTPEGINPLEWYIIAIRPNMELLGLALETYLSETAASEYHERVMDWFNGCARSGVISELNIGNGTKFMDRWAIKV